MNPHPRRDKFGRYISKKHEVNCTICGKTLLRPKCQIGKNILCSKDCIIIWKKRDFKPPIQNGIKNVNYNPDLHITQKTLCHCGCNDYVEHSKAKPKKFIHGHNSRVRTREQKNKQIKIAQDKRRQILAEEGRKTPFYKLLKVSQEYSQWRKKVFERDGWKCQRCNNSGILNVHHKTPFAILYKQIFDKNKTIEELFIIAKGFNKLWDINNGITLCVNCHKKEHHPHYILKETLPLPT